MECTSYLTADEVAAAQALHKRAPYSIGNVSTGFFSLARHYGGMDYNGCHYVYMPGHDECVRDDVLKLVTKLRKQAQRERADLQSIAGLDMQSWLELGSDMEPKEMKKPEGRAHRFDEDAVCKVCGFDGAEWAHWKRSTCEGQASDITRPLCTQPGLDRDTHDEPDF